MRGQLASRGATLTSAGDRRRPTRVVIAGPGTRREATVRTTDGFRTWQLSLTPFLSVADDGKGRQHITRRTLERPDDVCIFVWLGERRSKPDRFFLLSAGELQEIVRGVHQWWLDEHGGTRPVTPESMHTAVSPENLAKYEDRWSLIETAL